ncbi:hypothetical protein C9I57_12925 [Trinickia symbiotica]|uniref:Uncharacterized protein n=1 Tax=Trinickia symbiotica TaxID=863227 RepID=A0A2T3XW19_9BURK|nr:hypothetical protein C9I57_12925 [Trinickia symbiotica]
MCDLIYTRSIMLAAYRLHQGESDPRGDRNSPTLIVRVHNGLTVGYEVAGDRADVKRRVSTAPSDAGWQGLTSSDEVQAYAWLGSRFCALGHEIAQMLTTIAMNGAAAIQRLAMRTAVSDFRRVSLSITC